MEWTELVVETTLEASDAVVEILMQNGAGGVQFDDENGNLNADLSADGAHVLGKYYADWSDWILQKLQQQDMK